MKRVKVGKTTGGEPEMETAKYAKDAKTARGWRVASCL